jgi:hypothetical protein
MSLRTYNNSYHRTLNDLYASLIKYINHLYFSFIISIPSSDTVNLRIKKRPPFLEGAAKLYTLTTLALLLNVKYVQVGEDFPITLGKLTNH